MGSSDFPYLNFMGLRLDVFKDVYTPQEDSFLLAKHTHSLEGNILELGTGCGLSALLNASRNPSNYVFGVDLNHSAVQNAAYNARHNQIKNAHFQHSDLFSNIPNVRFDSILFNPPYLPEEENGTQKESMLDLALYGGKNGRKQTDVFLHHLEDHLLPGGNAFLIQSSLTDIPKTVERANILGFSAEIVEEQSFFFEKLSLLKLFRE
jgi:release factor glutamine methyltransferase